jgi:hypothetical protein
MYKRVRVYQCKCERCEHEWITRKKGKPKVCPKCTSPYWNDVPKNSNKNDKDKNSYDIMV